VCVTVWRGQFIWCTNISVRITVGVDLSKRLRWMLILIRECEGIIGSYVH
jgi:hypothetical protein